MKQIYVVFEDIEFKELTKKKAKMSWREFILSLAQIKKQS